MKLLLFCSILIAILNFSCKPKPLDNLKEVALTVEENKVKRMSRQQIAVETQRVADSVLTLVIVAAQEKTLSGDTNSDDNCNFRTHPAYRQFQEKYKGRAQVLTQPAEIKQLTAEMENLRQYRNELSEPAGNFPATFQTLTDSLLYVRRIAKGQQLCEQWATTGFWVFRMPKQKLIEIKTVKVKPKPAKGPNW